MYLYYDASGSLKEIINDIPLRQGSSNWNKIYIYWKGIEKNNSFVRLMSQFVLPNNDRFPVSAEIQATEVISEIPYNNSRDLYFFEYYREYTFFRIDVPDEVLASAGSILLSPRIIEAFNFIISLEAIPFFVEATALGSIAPNEYLNIAQYNELLKILAGKLDAYTKSVIVDVLPESGVPNTLYFVKGTLTGEPYKVYIWYRFNDDPNYPGSWKLLGEVSGDFASKQEEREFEQDLLAQFNAYKQQVDNKVNNALDMTPIPVATVNDLPPQGATQPYVVAENGYWYYWNGSSWVQGQQYQAVTGYKTLPLGTLNKAYINEIVNNEGSLCYIELEGINAEELIDNTIQSTFVGYGYAWYDIESGKVLLWLSQSLIEVVIEGNNYYVNNYNTAKRTYYNNENSGLEADNVQDAIDETNAKIVSGKNKYNNKLPITQGWLNSDGSVIDSSSYSITDYVFLKQGTYTVSFGVVAGGDIRVVACFYSQRGNVDTSISNYINETGLYSLTFTMAKNGYVRICFPTEQVPYTNRIQIEEGNVTTHFEEYNCNLLNEKKEESYFENTINLVNDEKNVSGYVIQNGKIGASDSYITTDFIPIKQGQTYTNKGLSRFVLITNIDSSQRTYISTQENNYSFEAEYDGYVRITYYSTDTQFMFVLGNNIEKFIPYGFKPKNNIFPNDNFTKNNFTSVLSNKKYVACGDSFTDGGYTGEEGLPLDYYTYTTGEYAGRQKTYPFIIGLRNNMIVVNEAVGGSTLANYEGATGNQAFCLTRYQNIPADADYITLKFGINDSHHNIPIGTPDDEVDTTFCGAYNKVLTYLITNYPKAKIGIICSNGCDSKDYPEASKTMAKKYGIPYLDEVEDDEVPIMIRTYRTGVSNTIQNIKNEVFRVSATNLHPNVDCQYFESTFVEAFLKRL